MDRKSFDSIVKRYGPRAVEEALRYRYRKVSFKETTAAHPDHFSKAGYRAYLELFETPDPEVLWKAYRGVSEPATVPRQSPGAGDTPVVQGRDGDLRK